MRSMTVAKFYNKIGSFAKFIKINEILQCFKNYTMTFIDNTKFSGTPDCVNKTKKNLSVSLIIILRQWLTFSSNETPIRHFSLNWWIRFLLHTLRYSTLIINFLLLLAYLLKSQRVEYIKSQEKIPFYRIVASTWDKK